MLSDIALGTLAYTRLRFWLLWTSVAPLRA
jgi:hypothetical protein